MQSKCATYYWLKMAGFDEGDETGKRKERREKGEENTECAIMTWVGLGNRLGNSVD